MIAVSTLRFHAGAKARNKILLNDANAPITILNKELNLVTTEEKPKLVLILFTHAADKAILTFKEGSQRNRMANLWHTLNNNYSLAGNSAIYFSEKPTVSPRADRYIICKGIDTNNNLLVYRFDAFKFQTLPSHTIDPSYLFHSLLKNPINNYEAQAIVKLVDEGKIPLYQIKNNNLMIIHDISPQNFINILAQNPYFSAHQ